MSSDNRSSERRHHIRYRLKNTVFATIQGDYFAHLACVTDLNSNGVGFYCTDEGKTFPGKFIILDLVSDRNRSILCSLSARIVFATETGRRKNDLETVPKRYGFKFVNLSALEKRQLDLITKKYALSE